MIAWGWKGKGGQGEMAKGLGNFFFGVMRVFSN